MTESVTHICEGCGGRLVATDDVRALYRERLDPLRPEDVDRPRWSYCHLGHEPAKYVITGRGQLADLEAQRTAG